MQELRCEGNKLHGVLGDDIVEFKCNSRFCGAGSGVSVIHQFRVSTGELIATRKYKEPTKGVTHGNHRTAVRSS